MITHDEMTDAFTEVLAAAGARVCASCGSRALLRVDEGAMEADARHDHDTGDHVDHIKWFCFACGTELRN
jgi:hypothetical protein